MKSDLNLSNRMEHSNIPDIMCSYIEASKDHLQKKHTKNQYCKYTDTTSNEHGHNLNKIQQKGYWRSFIIFRCSNSIFFGYLNCSFGVRFTSHISIFTIRLEIIKLH